MKLFSLDGPFQKYGTMLFDLLMLNLLWALTVILTLGIGTGAATTALFYVVDKSIIRENGYVISSYFKSFKANFAKATLIWLFLAVAYGVVLFNLFILDLRNLPLRSLFIVANYVVLYQIVLLTSYIFPLIAKIELFKTRDYFTTAFKLANGHVIASLSCAVIVVATCVAQYLVPLYAILSLSVAATMISKVVVGRVLKKYYGEDALNCDIDEVIDSEN